MLLYRVSLTTEKLNAFYNTKKGNVCLHKERYFCHRIKTVGTQFEEPPMSLHTSTRQTQMSLHTNTRLIQVSDL